MTEEPEQLDEMAERRALEKGEFRYRLQHIEECIHRLELEVSALKQAESMSTPRLDRIESDLRKTEAELAALQGLNTQHGVRLDQIEKTLTDIHADIKGMAQHMKDAQASQRSDLNAHTRMEESWQRKMLLAMVTLLGTGVITLVAVVASSSLAVSQ